jgi:hypothetical protein
MQDWSSVNAQPDQANIFAVVSSFLKSAREERKQTNNNNNTRRRTGQVQL